MGAGTAALGAVGSLSGCSAIQDLIPGGGGGLGNFSNWVYAPDTFESDAEGINVSAFSYSGYLSNDGNLAESTYVGVKQQSWSQTGIDAADVNMLARLPNGRVFKGSFDLDAVKEELQAGDNDESDAGTQYESDGTYNDNYDIFVREDQDEPSHAYAVGNGNVIRGNRVANTGNDSDPVSAGDVVRGMIDTGSNGDNRFSDSDDTFGALVDAVDNGVSVSYELRQNEVGSDDGPDEDPLNGLFDGLVGEGFSLKINGGTTNYQYVFVYGGEGDVNESDVNDWVEANDTGDGRLSDLNDISVSTDGRTATVTGKRDTIEL
jgi:hypothetical protein